MELNPGYKQTEIGVIPEEWDAGGLGRFWTVTDCKHVTAQFVPHGFPVASIKEVQNRFVELTNAKQTTNHFYSLLIEGGRKPCPGDLILSRNATVGEVAQVAEWHPPFAMGQDVCLLQKKSPDHSTEFLQAVFQSPVITNQLSNLMVGSTFKRVNVEQIRNFSVPMPPPPEQRAIGRALSDVDELIGALEQLIAKKRDLKQATMQQLLTGQTRLPGFSGKWEVKRLEKSCEMITKGTTPTSIGRNFTEASINFLKAESISESGQPLPEKVAFIDTATHKLLKRSQLKEGDLLISIAGVLGRVGCISSDILPANTNQALAIVRLGNSPELERSFLFYCLRSPMITKQIKDVNVQAAQANISLKNVRELELRVPPTRGEQTAIAEVLSDMDAELAALEQRRDKTLAFKQGMMQELLTGRTRLV